MRESEEKWGNKGLYCTKCNNKTFKIRWFDAEVWLKCAKCENITINKFQAPSFSGV